MQKTLGGDRLGSGSKQTVTLHHYERSTHDIGYTWRSTMSPGTLVPFLSEVALPGDTFDIDLTLHILTNPTVGPLFGNYKAQLDLFLAPIRLYQGKLHMNKLGIGMDMSKVTLPLVKLFGNQLDLSKPVDNQHLNPSSIFTYLGIRGLGWTEEDLPEVHRHFNAIPYLAYWDIYKNYYSNKQEEIGAVIHKNVNPVNATITSGVFQNTTPGLTLTVANTAPTTSTEILLEASSRLIVQGTNLGQLNPTYIALSVDVAGVIGWLSPLDIFEQYVQYDNSIIYYSPKDKRKFWKFANIYPTPPVRGSYSETPEIVTFPLENIDKMREDILKHVSTDTPFIIDHNTYAPYGLPIGGYGTLGSMSYPIQYSQEGLALKTYQSDLFNNWLKTEWITGPDSISEITAISTAGDNKFTIDEFMLSKKVYDMLNRIAISGGTYDDWLDAVYTHDRQRSAENPIYMGGMIHRVGFQEVVSTAETEGKQLGTLAGRGTVYGNPKGGKSIIKVDEPSYVIGIVSLTPIIDYSQGNKWDVNLKTLNDLHKPALDQIGFQDLITDQMAWWDTQLTSTPDIWTTTFKSAGKQPAWVNYMTNINRVYGAFANPDELMFMVLNRRYEPNLQGGSGRAVTIQDLTTYIDPSKYNYIFADARLDAQNFWTQIGVHITARRKMSAKVMPNL